MKKLLIVLLLFLLSISLVNASPIWSKFQNSLENNGVTNFLGPQNSRLLCKTEKLNHYLSTSSPVVAEDGTIYVGTFTKNLYAINSDCSIKWTFTGETNGGFLTPVIGDDGTIYASNGVKLYAINPDGTKKWEYEPNLGFGFNFKSEPAIYNNIIYIGGTYTLLGINTNDGSLKCKFTSEGSENSNTPSVIGTPSIYNENIYITDIHSVYRLDLNCNKVWKYFVDRVYQRTPVINDGKIYVTNSPYPGNINVITDEGKKDFSFKANQANTLVVSNGNVYAVGDNKKLYIFDSTGSKKCEFTANDKFEAAPLVDSSGNVYVGNEDKNFYAIDNNCNLLWKYTTNGKITRSAAFGINNTLIVPSKDAVVYVFGYYTKNQIVNNEEDNLPEIPIVDVTPTEQDYCNSCLIIGRKTGNDFVNSCNGGLRDVEGCYSSKYNCNTKEIISKKLCDSCNDAECTDSSTPVINLDISADVPESSFIFDCKKYNCKGNIPKLTPDLLNSCTDTDKEDSYTIKGMVSSDKNSVADSCLIATRRGSLNFVDTCSGGFRDVEACYLLQYSCNNNKLTSKKTLCNSCNDGICLDFSVKKESNIFSRFINWFKKLFT